MFHKMKDESLARRNVAFLLDHSSQCGHLTEHGKQWLSFFPPKLINVCSQDLDYCITSHKFARLKMSVELISCKST